MDKLSRAERSENMRRIRSKDSHPEIMVRSLAHALGYRFRLHRRDLPGKPDLVFPSRRKVIFVHGCFWHLHGRCREGRIPKSRQSYWRPKLERNRERDARNRRKLASLGWACLVIWECETVSAVRLEQRLQRFLG